MKRLATAAMMTVSFMVVREKFLVVWVLVW